MATTAASEAESSSENGIAVYDITVSPAHLDLDVVQGEAEVIGSGSVRRVSLPSNGVVQLEATCGGYEPKTTWLRPSNDANRSLQLSLAEIEKKEGPVTIVDKLAIPADGMVAAGLSNLIVASPSERTVRCYDIERPAEGRTRSIPIAGAIKAIALGYASRGPLLVFWAPERTPDARRVTGACYTLLDVKTLGAIRIDGIAKQRSGYPESIGRPLARGTVRLENNSDHDEVRLRASGSGDVFGLWRVNYPRSGVESLVVDGQWVVNYQQEDSVGYVVPNADGTVLCTESGLYRADLAGKRGDQACIPSYHPDYYMTVPLPTERKKSGRSEHLTIRSTESGEPIFEFLRPEEMASLKTREWPKRDLTLDKRYHLFPEAGRLITIPEGNGKLILRQVDLGITRAVGDDSDQEAESPSVKSRPNREVREWTDKSGKFQVTATFVSLAAGRVRLRKANGQVITVELDKPSEADVAYIKDIGG